MKIDTSKLARQETGVQKWLNNKGVGTLNWPTGFGKTFTAMTMIVARVLAKYPEAKIRVVVPSDQLRTDWKEALSSYVGETPNVVIETIHYYQEQRTTHVCHLVIYDEVHEYLSEDRRNIFTTWIDSKFRLALTATYEDRYLRHSTIENHLPIVDIISEKEALDNNWIAQSFVFNYMLTLDTEEQAEYEKQSKYINEHLAKFNNDFTLAQKCLGGGYNSQGIKQDNNYYARWVAKQNGFTYEMSKALMNKQGSPAQLAEWQRIADIWHPDKIKGYAGGVLAATKKRKDILYNSAQKLEVVKDIILHVRTKFIVFSQSTAFVDRLVGELTKNKIKTAAYHSNLSSIPLRKDRKTGKPSLTGTGDFVRYKTGAKKGKPKIHAGATLKKLAIEELRANKLEGICTASALDKGFDDRTISLAITAGFTGSSTQMKQRKGRATRINPENSEVPVIIVNLVFINTAEEWWLKEAQSTQDKDKVYWINSVSQISTNPTETVTETDFFI